MIPTPPSPGQPRRPPPGGPMRPDATRGPNGPTGGGQPATSVNVNLAQPGLGGIYDGRQTNANANYYRAMADFAGNPRAASKQYQRGGISSSAGTDSLGAADAANAYAQNLAASEQARMGDAYANANYNLDDTINRNRFGTALSGLQEQFSQADWMNNMNSAQNAFGFMGNMFGNMTSAFGGRGNNSLLSGLL
jgi:hypothetical protein